MATMVIGIGTRVRVRDQEGEEHYTIVDPSDADPGRGLISSESPMGRALTGRSVGETVKVPGPSGAFYAQILEVR